MNDPSANRNQILQLLRDPEAFANDVAPGQAEIWLRGLNEFAIPILAETNAELRAGQLAAWNGSAAKRLVLVLGPPGTGKTHILAWLAAGFLFARKQAGQSCRMLITGFTRESIGNLLEKIAAITGKHLPTPVVFLGNPPESLAAGIDTLEFDSWDIAPVVELFKQPSIVVGATCWSLYKAFDGGNFPGKDGPTAQVFDLILIDEASQMIVSQGLMSVGGMAPGCRVIVAGDNKQLPPIRPTFDATDGHGRVLGSSLFDFLEHAGVAKFVLDETFRLNQPLAIFSSEKFYEGNYRSAVKNRALALKPGWEAGLLKWQQAALDPNYPIVVLLHDGPMNGTENPFERKIIKELVSLLITRLLPDAGQSQLDPETLWRDRLAVVTPHRAQNAALRGDLKSLTLCHEALVETVDRIQGRERDVIIAGYTVSDREFALMVAPFIFSEQRLNVTVTRARSKLILLVSRRLLEVMPPDEEVFAAADKLRDYVYECQRVDEISLPGPDGNSFAVELRVRQFDESQALPPLQDDTPVAPPRPAWTPQLEQLLTTIREISGETPWGNAIQGTVEKRLGRAIPLSEFRQLVQHGRILAERITNTRNPFWKFTPLEQPRVHFPADLATVQREIAGVCWLARQGKPLARYTAVRDYFVWFDENGIDVFRPLALTLVPEVCQFRKVEKTEYFDLVSAFTDRPIIPPAPPLQDGDWRVLNQLEDEEVKLINFGVYETFIRPSQLSTILGIPNLDMLQSLRRLEAQHYLLWVDDEGEGAVRSRMSEMARSVRYVKQRFNSSDANFRPFVSRSVRIEVRNRNKPVRNRKLAETIAELKPQLAAVPMAAEVLDRLADMLAEVWKVAEPNGVLLAEFQRRGLREILPAYLGLTPHDAFVITADTGSGKTETACLPLIAGAAIDRLAGRSGVKAILTYPRLRLAYNQAQRLVKYLAAMSRQPGMPLLTLGIQTKDVPQSARYATSGDAGTLWHRIDGRGFNYPFFNCPDCDSELHLLPSASKQQPDSLKCSECEWSFAGLIAFKEGLRINPPDFFIPVTESLHQWMQDPRSGSLFGDLKTFAPPRALLADEIHLYSHIHGAQIGYAFRRALARAYLNERMDCHCGAGAHRPLAIGMSATLGDPAAIWGKLSGRGDVRQIAVRETAEIPGEPAEREENPQAREYFYFVQTEVESRGTEVAAASTTIQSLMCLAHNMRRRSADEGGFRGIAFFDSIDHLKRLHEDYRDAEENKGLARYRLKDFGPNPVTGKPRTACCGNPASCDIFRSGECWYFAARAPGGDHCNDPHQITVSGPAMPGRSLRVIRQPVSSRGGGRVDQNIRRSDLVFSTSSLEVGFDDPAMMLVYQHYAPRNLASFIQRKGRGGRGVDDRPVTGITLSLYSPRDSWYFRHPQQMLDTNAFEVPLNMDNFFVRRGQALAVVLDGIARRCAQLGRDRLPQPIRVDQAEQLEKAISSDGDAINDLVILSMGKEIYKSLGANNPRQLLRKAIEDISERPPVDDPRTWRDLLPWIPNQLFDAINLPMLRVDYLNDDQTQGSKLEDIALAFGRLCPGNPTRKYGHGLIHWLPPGDIADGPMFDNLEMYDKAIQEPLLLPAQAAGKNLTQQDAFIREQLPQEVIDRLPAGLAIHTKLCRPHALSLAVLGEQKEAFGKVKWLPQWFWDETNRQAVQTSPDDAKNQGYLKIGHKSRSRLLGFPLVQANDLHASSESIEGLLRLGGKLTVFTGGFLSQSETGLNVIRAFWGVDVELLLPNFDRKEQWTKAFTTRNREKVLLHGYRVETEGIQLPVNSKALDEFIDLESNALTVDQPRNRWLRGQFFRYLLSNRFSAAGLSSYASGPLADLIVATRIDPGLWAELSAQAKNPSARGLESILKRARAMLLASHPLLQDNALRRHLDAIADGDFPAIFSSSVKDVADDAKFRGYLRSLVLHGLALSLQELFILHGRGDENQVSIHARLPIQFGNRANDILTVFEGGDHGDGTTRSFQTHIDRAFATWRRGEWAQCPYAAEDALIDMLFDAENAQPGLHARWRQMDPHDPVTLRTIARELTGTTAVEPEHLQVLARVLFHVEPAGVRRLPVYPLHQQVRLVRQQMIADLKRSPTAWELISAVVRRVKADDPQLPQVIELLHAYEAIPGPLAGGIDPMTRLTEQLYRMTAGLCVDGCPACLHRSSTLMPDTQMIHALSRNLLERYREFVLQPLTITVGPGDAFPSPLAITRRTHAHGWCRILVHPARYEALRPAAVAAGFDGAAFDPLLKAVVLSRRES